MTETTAPPNLPGELQGHARLTDQRRASLGGYATLTLYGSSEAPQLYAATPDAFSGISLTPHRDALVRFAREVLAFLGEDTGMGQLPPWRPANNGSGKRIWFLLRDGRETDDSLPLKDRYHFSARGVLVRYATMESAQRAADKLNAEKAG